jgi:hypothetical protein
MCFAKKLKKAFKSNDIQTSTVAMLSVLNLCALCSRLDHGPIVWYAWIVAGLFWPTFAFIANFFDPIP